MYLSPKVVMTILCFVLAGCLALAGCTSNPPVSSGPAGSGAGAPHQSPGAAAPQGDIRTPRETAGYPGTEDDTIFSKALMESISSLEPRLQMIMDSSESLDARALRENGTLLAQESENAYRTISKIPVSRAVQPMKDNYLNALSKFKESGMKISQGTDAMDMGDMDTAERLLTEAGDALAAGSEFLNLTEDSATRIGF